MLWRCLLRGRFLFSSAAFLLACAWSGPQGWNELRAAEPSFEQVRLGDEGVALPSRRPEFRFLRLKHHWTGESLETVYRIDGKLQTEAMAEINHFLRDWRCNQETEIDPLLIDRLYELQRDIGEGRVIRVISAYRSEGYNASLLLAGRTVDPGSQHMYGRAVDVFVRGFPLAELKEAAEMHHAGGTGYYPFSGPRFIHVDTGPERYWAEMDPGEHRKLGLPRRQRKRLKLNCSLKMADVLQEVSVGEVMASLPAGASLDPDAKIYRASYAGRNREQADDPVAPEGEAQDADSRSLCVVGDQIPKLSPQRLFRR